MFVYFSIYERQKMEELKVEMRCLKEAFATEAPDVTQDLTNDPQLQNSENTCEVTVSNFHEKYTFKT